MACQSAYASARSPIIRFGIRKLQSTWATKQTTDDDRATGRQQRYSLLVTALSSARHARSGSGSRLATDTTSRQNAQFRRTVARNRSHARARRPPLFRFSESASPVARSRLNAGAGSERAADTADRAALAAVAALADSIQATAATRVTTTAGQLPPATQARARLKDRVSPRPLELAGRASVSASSRVRWRRLRLRWSR